MGDTTDFQPTYLTDQIYNLSYEIVYRDLLLRVYEQLDICISRLSTSDDSIAAVLTASSNDIVWLCCNNFYLISRQLSPRINCALRWIFAGGFANKITVCSESF